MTELENSKPGTANRSVLSINIFEQHLLMVEKNCLSTVSILKTKLNWYSQTRILEGIKKCNEIQGDLFELNNLSNFSISGSTLEKFSYP